MVDDEQESDQSIHYLDTRQAEVSLRLQRMYEGICSEDQPERLKQLAFRLGRAYMHRHGHRDADAEDAPPLEDPPPNDAELSDADLVHAEQQPRPDAEGISDADGIAAEAGDPQPTEGDPEPEDGDPPLSV